MISLALTPWFVFAVIIIVFGAIYIGRVRPVVSMFLGVLVLIIAGILTPTESMAGLSNTSILSVVILVLITSGLRNSFNVDKFIDRFYRGTKSYRRFLFFMMCKVSALSTVLNNTPVVALMTPYLVKWGKSNNISPSKLLIPLSYSTILGGMITIIGTSTTLVLNGFLVENGLAGLNQQDLMLIGLPTAIIGISFILVGGKYLLPDKTDIVERFEKNTREYLVSVKVLPKSNIAGQTIAEANLRRLSGLFMVEIYRKGSAIYPVTPATTIKSGDILVFAGENDKIMELISNNTGLKLADGSISDSLHADHVTEAVISSNSSLIGKTIRETEFRNRYDGAVIAVHRNGTRLEGRIGDIRLFAGDVLLILSGSKFEERIDIYKDMYVIASSAAPLATNGNGYWKLITVLVTALILYISGVLNLFSSLLVLFGLMIVLKLLGMKNIKRDLDFNMVGIMVLSLALGQALITSGGGQLIADAIFDIAGPIGKSGIIIVLLVTTTLLTSFISNIGAVSMMFPIAYGLTNAMHINDPSLFLATAFAASCAFLTPIGYQTNMIIYGPGGYSFGDFLRIGLPFTMIYLASVYAALGILY